MELFLAEATIHVSNASTVIDQICVRLSEHCRTETTSRNDHVLIFGVGKAILRALDESIHLRVEASDIVACHSIKVALEGSIAELGSPPTSVLLWIAAKPEPFAALAEYLADPEELPIPNFLPNDRKLKGG